MTEYDLWINLLNFGSYEKIGRAVMKGLLEKKPKKDGSYRQIIVGGS